MNRAKSFGTRAPAVSRILVATDFSDQAHNALNLARFLADAFPAKLVLLHVIDIESLAEIASVPGGTDPLPIVRDCAEINMHKLKALMPDAETIVREGSTRRAIVEAALELKCQMIVIGTHGRSGLSHLLIGSVAEYVLHNCKLPVLTVSSRRQGPLKGSA
jgi:universal stress protein A